MFLLSSATAAADLDFEGGNEGIISLVPHLLAPHYPLQLCPE